MHLNIYFLFLRKNTNNTEQNEKETKKENGKTKETKEEKEKGSVVVDIICGKSNTIRQ